VVFQEAEMSEDESILFDTETKEFIYFTEAVNQILAAADCTEEVRSYVDFLIGASKGDFEFKASDDEVAKRAISKRERTAAGARRWLKRKRDMLEEWQTKRGILFVDCNVGSKNFVLNIKYKSVYRLYIVRYAEIVVEEAKNDSSTWDTSPFLAIENAAKQLVQKLQDNPANIIQKKPYKHRQSKSVTRKIHNLMRGVSNLQQLIIDGRPITDEDKNLFRLMEAGLKNVKKKIEDAENEGGEPP
jgi:hypothetical protein